MSRLSEQMTQDGAESRGHSGPSRAVLVDAHVHLHPCFEIPAFLNAATNNMTRTAMNMSVALEAGVLVVADPAGCNGFVRLKEFAASASNRPRVDRGSWGSRHTDESTSICLQRNDVSLAVIAGRQVRTAENLEVLLIGTRDEVRDDLPIEDVLLQSAHLDVPAIIPWGFGKWWGSRGELMRSLLRVDAIPFFLLGDNSNRPRLSIHPSLFRLASGDRGAPVPGSDPLPFPRETAVVGRYGFVIRKPFDAVRPTRFLINELSNRPFVAETYGRLEGPLRFVRNQISMQLVKHHDGRGRRAGC